MSQVNCDFEIRNIKSPEKYIFWITNWDQKRYDTLKGKIDAHWSIYNDIDAAIPAEASDEKARLKQKLEIIRKDLCGDFKELIDLHQNTLGVGLGDHYSLYNVCGDLA